MSEKADQALIFPISGAMQLDQLPFPVILISAKRLLLAANRIAVDIFGGFEAGKDLSSMIRHPDFLEACAQVFEQSELQDCEFVKAGRRRRTFQASISPFHNENAKGALIALHETTAASDAERMRSSFVADVSHELRSPLTTLIATTETLKGKAGEDRKTRTRFLDLMSHETNRMHKIVDDLLSLSATEAQEHILPEDNVNLGGIVRDISDVLLEKAKAKEMALVVTMDEELPDTRGDYDELYQVIHNLVDNAVKYGQSSTEVSISVGEQSDSVQVSVNNQGPPIAEKHMPRLTERFYRADKSRSRELGGTGLGLAIVKHIVNRHLGSLSIESNEADGTTFTVSFPIMVSV